MRTACFVALIAVLAQVTVSTTARAVVVSAVDLGGGQYQATLDFDNFTGNDPGPASASFDIRDSAGTSLLTVGWVDHGDTYTDLPPGTQISNFGLARGRISTDENGWFSAHRFTFSRGVTPVSIRILDQDIGEDVTFRGLTANETEVWTQDIAVDENNLRYDFDLAQAGNGTIRILNTESTLFGSQIEYDDLVFTFSTASASAVPAVLGPAVVAGALAILALICRTRQLQG